MSLSPHYIMFIRYKRSQFKYTCYYFIYIFTRYLYKYYKRNFFFQKRRRRIDILSLMSFAKITYWVFFKITRYMYIYKKKITGDLACLKRHNKSKIRYTNLERFFRHDEYMNKYTYINGVFNLCQHFEISYSRLAAEP